MTSTPLTRLGDLVSAPSSPRSHNHKRARNGDVLPSGLHTPAQAESGVAQQERFANDASIVLVGIRGSGKRSLGFIAATALGRRFITEDYWFQTVTGHSRQEFFRIHGSEEFHKQDVEISRTMLDENRHGCVIDCGLGSLTRALQEYLRSYSRTNPVIHIHRDMSRIKQLLNLNDKSAKMLESGDLSHRRCSNLEFFNIEDDSRTDVENDDDRASPTYSFKLRTAQVDFSRFTQSIAGPANGGYGDASALLSNVSFKSTLFSHSLCLPVTNYRAGNMDFTRLEGGGDIVEVAVDEWQESTPSLVSRLVAEARRKLDMPIMIGMMQIDSVFPVNLYFLAARHAFRLIPELVLVDLMLERNWIADLLNTKCSKTEIVGLIRYSTCATLLQKSDLVVALLEKAIALAIKIVRITAEATTRADQDRFDQFIRALKHRYASRLHFSAYLTGSYGRTVQLFNPMLTAVTHDTLRNTSGPGPDITAKEALTGLFSSYTLDPLQFYVLGANVSSSLSPAMHNAGYSFIGLPHRYDANNVASWEDIKIRAQASTFGGSSIAQPWKVKAVEHIEHFSNHARAIGAINTLIPLRGEQGEPIAIHNQAQYRNRAGQVLGFYGDNSDWISIQVTLNKHLSPRNVIHSKTSALIVGAGGMARAACYALLQLGCRNIFIYNRTIANADILARHFLAWAASQKFSQPASIKVLSNISGPWPEGFAQPTIIVSCVTHERLPNEEHVADFTVPEQWLGSETGGAAVEQAYYINTPFIQQMKGLRASTGKPWVVVDGLEVLHEQAVAQFEIMTGRKAPRTAMWEALQEGVVIRDGKV